MARIEHLNLVVSDIDKTLSFLSAAFPHWRNRGGGEDTWQDAPRRWMHFGDDETYLTLNHFLPLGEDRGAQRDLQGTSPGLAHVGFEVASIDGVVARLRDAGFEPRVWGPDHPHRRNVYFYDPEGLEFEFVEYFSDAPAERNSYV